MEDCGIDAKRLSISAFSFEDDCLIGSPLFRSPFAQQSPSHSHTNQPDEVPKSAEHEGRSKNVHKYNKRKSLAWDSEFFTCPGVLEPDELTSMIESAEKTEKHVLPRILEETQRSTDSISTLVSDSLTISRLEDEFFEYKRASIQRSGKASPVENSSRKARSVVSDSQTNQSSKKKDEASHGKLKPKPSPMKLSVGMAKSGKATNPVTIHPRVLQLRNNYTAGSSPSKPSKPETLSPVVSSTKRDSIRPKAENNNAEGAVGRRASSSKINAPNVSHSVLPGPSSSRYTSSPSAANNAMTSSVDSSVSGPSSSLTKSAVFTKDRRSSYASVLKTAPPRTVQSVNGPPRNGHALSGSKLSSSVSLASSMGDWSSKTSFSTSTTKRGSKSARASIGIISSPKVVPREGGAGTPRTMVILKRSNDPQIPRISAQSTPNRRSASSARKGTNSVKPSGAAKLLSSNMSPASSISRSSSASLSSVSTTKPRSSSATARAGNSSQKAAACREGGGVPGTSKSPRLSNDQQLDEQKTKVSARPAQNGRSSSTGRLAVKPSALRMPSPKISVLNGVKSGRTPKETKQQLPHVVSSDLPKIEAKNVNADEGINRLRVGLIKSPKSAMTSASKKPENHKQSASGATSGSHQEPSSSVKRISSSASNIQDFNYANAPKEVPASAEQDGCIVMLRDKDIPPEVKSIGVQVGGEDPAAKVETVATSKEQVTVDSSVQVSEILCSGEAHVVAVVDCCSKLSSSAKTDQLAGGGGARMPFAAIHSFCNVDDSSDHVSAQVEKRITITSST